MNVLKLKWTMRELYERLGDLEELHGELGSMTITDDGEAEYVAGRMHGLRDAIDSIKAMLEG